MTINKNTRKGKKLIKLIKLMKILLQLVPMGKVISYKELSYFLGVHPRQAGKLLSMNDEPIIVPCHRVVMSDGRLGGYSGAGGPAFKEKLLLLEGVEVVNGRIPKKYFITLKDLLE